LRIFPVSSLLNREIDDGEWFAADCVIRQPVRDFHVLSGKIEAVLASVISAGVDLLGQGEQGGSINWTEVGIAGASGFAGAGFSSPFAGTGDEGLNVTGEIIGDTGGGALGLIFGGLSGGGGSSSCGCSK
jgi:hypothetical protein